MVEPGIKHVIGKGRVISYHSAGDELIFGQGEKMVHLVEVSTTSQRDVCVGGQKS